MLACQAHEPGAGDIAQTIRQHIIERTAGRIRALNVELTEGKVIIHGCTPTYYSKQLALQGALDVIASVGSPRIELDVSVVGFPAKPNDRADLPRIPA